MEKKLLYRLRFFVAIAQCMSTYQYFPYTRSLVILRAKLSVVRCENNDNY